MHPRGHRNFYHRPAVDRRWGSLYCRTGVRKGRCARPRPCSIGNTADELKAIARERARRRQLSQLKRGHQEPVKELFPEREKGQTRDKVAAAIGIGSGPPRAGM